MDRWNVYVFDMYLLITLGIASCSIVTVETNLGSVDGSVETVVIRDENDTPVNYTYHQFLGIPYAEPPVRFEKPVAKQSWTGTHNGTYYRPICHQSADTGPISIKGNVQSEDCLTLDIYKPTTPISNATSYAVIVFLYGPYGGSSGFIGDALSAYGEIIVVVINYRTTFLGFYSSGDNSAPGNYGLWDQQLAIQWVSDNIVTFQGDPSRVTLAGYSAGAQYALLQAMYPGNMGLISNVIAHSGILVPTYRNSPYNNTGAPAAVQALGCNRESSEATMECLRSKSLVDLDSVLHSLPVTFTPVVDGDFIKQDPQTALTSTDPESQNVRDTFSSVNLLTGITNMEGATHVVKMWAPLLNQQVDTFQINSTSFRNTVVKTALDLAFVPNLSDAIIDTVAFQYSDLKDPNNMRKIRESTVQLSTDIDATIPAVKTANLHSTLADTSRTFFFQFSVKLGMMVNLTPSWLDGANHGEEIYFLFGFSSRNLEAWTHSGSFVPTEKQRNVSRNIMELWSNFVKYGNPTYNQTTDVISEWPEYTEMTSVYLDITSEGFIPKHYFREPFVTFWTKIIPSLIDLDSSKSVPSEADEVPQTKQFSDRFDIDSLTSENIIIALVTISGSLLIAVLLVCSLAVIKGSYEKYPVKNV